MNTNGWRNPHTSAAFGYLQCEWVQSRTQKHAEYASGNRQNEMRKGQQCIRRVSRKAREKTGGVPICPVHRAAFWARVDEGEATRQRLRAKYDPGPLPLDGDDDA